MAESRAVYAYDQPGDADKQGVDLPQVTLAQPPAYAAPPTQYGGFSYPAAASQSSSTTVVVNQPTAMPRGPRDWNTKMCDCCSDMGICMCGMFCGCCLASQVAQDMGESSCVPCCVPGWLSALRLKMRTQEKIPGSLMDDCCVSAFCGACTLCQLAREVRYVQLLNAQHTAVAAAATGY